MAREHEYDVVIVGGGHNGLVAACYLARAGLRVVVVEKNDHLGGMAASLPLFEAAPGHLANPGAYENVFLRASGVVEDLELARFGYREVESAGWAWLGEEGESLLFQRDAEATARDISRFSRADAGRYLELVRSALRILDIQGRYAVRPPSHPGIRLLVRTGRTLVADPRLRAALGTLVGSTAADAIRSTFDSPQVRGAFASIATILGAPTVEGSGLALLGTSSLHHKGAGRPIGGMGGLVTALSRCLAAHEAAVHLGAAAVWMAPSANGRSLVELEDGATLHARQAIVAALPPQRLPDLIGDLPGDVGDRLRGAPANAAGVATLTVNLALHGRVEVPAHQAARPGDDLRRPALFTGSFESVLAACARSVRGELPVAMPWWATIFTAMDPAQAPDGQDVMQLCGPVPVRPREGWQAAREAAAELLIGDAATAMPSLSDLELDRFIETPEELTARTGTVNGCLYHVDHLPTRMGPMRPAVGVSGYRLPVAGVYLTGAGCHPGGGISGLPGRGAARAVLEDLQQKGGRRRGLPGRHKHPARYPRTPLRRSADAP